MSSKFTIKKARPETEIEKRYRYSIRKFNVGVASVAISAFMFMGGGLVSADMTEATEVAESSQSELVSSATVDEVASSTESVSTVDEATKSEVVTETAESTEEIAASESASSTVNEEVSSSTANEEVSSSTANEEVSSSTVNEEVSSSTANEEVSSSTASKEEASNTKTEAAVVEGRKNKFNVNVVRNDETTAMNNAETLSVLFADDNSTLRNEYEIVVEDTSYDIIARENTSLPENTIQLVQAGKDG